jgi:hypothetical protein
VQRGSRATQDTCSGYLIGIPPFFDCAYKDEPLLLFNNLFPQMLHLGHVLQRDVIRAMETAGFAARTDGVNA